MVKAKKIAYRTILLSIISSVLLALLKGYSGFAGHSDALIADAIESGTDVVASFLVLFGIYYSTKPADDEHPYGHGKAEALVTFGVVGILLISATLIAYNGIQHLSIEQEQPELFTIFVLIGIIIWKELSYRYVLSKGKKTNSLSIQADAWHHRSDAISSLIALFGISLSLLFGPAFSKADDWAAIAASLFIVYNAYIIFRPALGEILDEHNHHELIDKIKLMETHIAGVQGIEKCLVRKTGMTYLVDLHLEVAGSISVNEGHRIAHEFKDYLQGQLPEINDVLIHIEPFENKNRTDLLKQPITL
ncbi:MAG: cation diffusion facilitator family transporter [Crocinitomicaceae bacterium]|nr:cation diffusion facilitator family transporter [Crocinitomicaceae bacterium]